MRPIAGFAASAIVLLSSVAQAAEEQKGMPQLDFANPLTISQVVWLAIIFACLYALLARWGLPLVGKVLEERAARISADLEAAHAAKVRSDAAVAELTAATRQAYNAAQAQITSAVDQAKKEAAARAVVLNERLEAQLADAEARIAAARAAAVGALRQVANETAAVVINRLAGLSPDAQTLDRAVGDALAATGRA